jgi:hypothetical protein
VPAKERYVVATLLAKELDKAPPMARFFGRHAVKDGRRSRKILAEILGEIGIDMARARISGSEKSSKLRILEFDAGDTHTTRILTGKGLPFSRD